MNHTPTPHLSFESNIQASWVLLSRCMGISNYLPDQVTSQVHCLAKFPTLTLTNPLCIPLTPSQAQWKIWKRIIFALGGGGDDDDGNEFLLTACEVSGPTLNALLSSPHLILTKNLLHMHNRWGNWHIKRLNDSPKISQLESNRTQDVNLGLSDTTLSF